MDDSWDSVKQSMRVGARVKGIVREHRPFGIFVSLDDVPFRGLIQITDFKDADRMTPDEYPNLGTALEAIVLGFKEQERQIWLGVKPSQLSGLG